MTFDVKNETIGHLYGRSIFYCNFFFLQSIPKKSQLYNVDKKTYFENDFLLFVRGQFNMLCRRH